MRDEDTLEMAIKTKIKYCKVNGKSATDKPDKFLTACIKALRKQTPTKPEKLHIRRANGSLKLFCNCPFCGGRIDSEVKDHHCIGCGQTIDWTEVEE